MSLMKRAGGPFLPGVCLRGDRVFLRPPQRADGRQWLECRAQNREHLEPFEPRWPEDCLTRLFFERRLARQVRDWDTGRGYAFLVFRAGDRRLIGGISINNVCRGAAQFASLGYWIAKECEGRGYMKEALALIIEYAFTDLKLHRLNAACLSHNTRSRHLLKRLGFEEEGTARAYLQIDGRRQDHVLYGLNYDDWQALQEYNTPPGEAAQDQA